MANFKAIMRLLKRFTQQDNDRISGNLYRWPFGQLKLDGLTLDLDSTVMTRQLNGGEPQTKTFLSTLRVKG